jgi:arginine:ornithine antiporter/lysine permease
VQLFTTVELVIFGITVLAGLIGFYGLVTGLITH